VVTSHLQRGSAITQNCRSVLAEALAYGQPVVAAALSGGGLDNSGTAVTGASTGIALTAWSPTGKPHPTALGRVGRAGLGNIGSMDPANPSRPASTACAVPAAPTRELRHDPW
jgi:hypothetical protein